jgi:hypothetical protein
VSENWQYACEQLPKSETSRTRISSRWRENIDLEELMAGNPKKEPMAREGN